MSLAVVLAKGSSSKDGKRRHRWATKKVAPSDEGIEWNAKLQLASYEIININTSHPGFSRRNYSFHRVRLSVLYTLQAEILADPKYFLTLSVQYFVTVDGCKSCRSPRPHTFVLTSANNYRTLDRATEESRGFVSDIWAFLFVLLLAMFSLVS